MKTIIITAVLLSGTVTGLFAQSQEPLSKEKMKPFENWIGQWQGEGYMQAGPGEPKKSAVTEHIQSKLDGTILLIEGIGRSTDSRATDSIVHHAMAILSYDDASQQYKLKSYLKNGKSTDAWFKVADENNFQWGFEVPNVKMRYSIILDPIKRTWHETGKFSQDGKNWQKVFEMNLSKIE